MSKVLRTQSTSSVTSLRYKCVTNKHFGVHNNDDSVFDSPDVFEQLKRAMSSDSKAPSTAYLLAKEEE